MNDYYGTGGCCLTCDKEEKREGCLCFDCKCKKCDDYISLEDGKGECIIARNAKTKSKLYRLREEWDNETRAIMKIKPDARMITEFQRKEIEGLLLKGKLDGKICGIDYLDRGEANKLLLLRKIKEAYESEISDLEGQLR